MFSARLNWEAFASETFTNAGPPKLSDDERDKLEGPLKFDECKKVLETFQNDKSPGEDGFTAEFYKFFFD